MASKKQIMTEDEIIRAWETVTTKPNTLEAAEAIAEVVERNDGLICMLISKHYSTYMGNHMDDMMQEGRMAIYENFPSFDPKKSRFSTFISYYIMHGISSYLCSLNGMTPHYLSMSKKLTKAYAALEAEGCSNPSIAQISEEMGVGKEAVHSILSIRNRTTGMLSLDDDSSSSMQVSDYTQLDPMEYVEEKITREALAKAIHELTPQEQAIVREIYFYDSDGTQALRVVAKNLGYRIDEVRRLKASAYRKLYMNPVLRDNAEDNTYALTNFLSSITIEYAPSEKLREDDLNTVLNLD